MCWWFIICKRICNDCKYRKFFLNAYWLKSGWVVLIFFAFLTSYPRIIKSFLKSTDLCFAVNRVCYLRKDALNGFDVCIGSAQMKKKCALGLHSKKKGYAGLNAYLQNERQGVWFTGVHLGSLVYIRLAKITVFCRSYIFFLRL
jgi:hypothetical protein